LVVVFWVVLVLVFVRVTAAFGTPAPLGSVTVPVTSPDVIDCALAFGHTMDAIKAAEHRSNRFRNIEPSFFLRQRCEDVA
jgi:hypothetical protein